ncbi:MAG: prolipoprotein diacylglyceryl transferase [Patescibacteria group bacterium]
MWPVLFKLGFFELRTYSLFASMAFLFSGFVFWRKGREEHYSELQLFDGFLLSSVFGLLIGRLGFIWLNFERFGWDLLKWIDLIGNPGSHLLLAMLGSFLYLARFAINKKWDVFEILDFWSLSYALNLLFQYLGYFFDGGIFGTETKLPWGIVFPGVFEKHHPVQLYFASFYFVLTLFLSRVEYRYRTFDWYRAGKRSAQTGFLLSSFLIAVGFFSFLMSFIKLPELIWMDVPLDSWIYLVIFLFGLLMMWKRSGRNFLPSRKKLGRDFINEERG